MSTAADSAAGEKKRRSVMHSQNPSTVLSKQQSSVSVFYNFLFSFSFCFVSLHAENNTFSFTKYVEA